MLRVLIPSFSDDLLQECFSAMEKLERGSTAAVIIGDNGLSERFIERWPFPRYVGVPRKHFCWADAINRCAMGAGRNDDFLILQDDTAPLTPSWLARCENLLLAWPMEYGILDLCQTTTAATYGREASASEPIETPTTIAFTGILIPRRIWNEIGPLDGRFTGYGHDDADYCLRLLHAGYKLGITGAAMIEHRHKGTVGFNRKLGPDGMRQQSALNHDFFHAKWGLPRPEPMEMKFLPAAPHFLRQACGCGLGL
jgi:hypothetical protein